MLGAFQSQLQIYSPCEQNAFSVGVQSSETKSKVPDWGMKWSRLCYRVKADSGTGSRPTLFQFQWLGKSLALCGTKVIVISEYPSSVGSAHLCYYLLRREITTVREGGGGSIFWKTRDIGLASYSNNLSTIPFHNSKWWVDPPVLCHQPVYSRHQAKRVGQSVQG